MSDDLDRERFDYDDRDTSPGAFHERILCEGCGREYEALVTFHDRSHDSPAWYEPEPGEERCPACRGEDVTLGAAELRGTPSPKCAGCGREIDPETCGCGAERQHHSYGDNHGFIPMGCDCYRDSAASAPKPVETS